MKEKPQINQELLLKIAEREFLQKGYQGARTVDIAKAAGVTHTMLHYYFGTKEQLFNRILTEKVAIVAQSVLVFAKNEELPLLERIALMIEMHFDILTQNCDLPRFFLNFLAENPQVIMQLTDQIETLKSDFLLSFQHDLDQACRQKIIKQTNATDLIFDILSVNAFTFIALPAATEFFGDKTLFLSQRRKRNVELVINNLKA
ncbi:MAG: TetR/AcrR family transcriptional regulator [Bacteroidales bacterium]|nr:TetR/AcrR family transcriptional regulator [Bacteroidales bacterium]